MTRSLGQDEPETQKFDSTETENLFCLIEQQLGDAAVSSDAGASVPIALPSAPASSLLLPAVRSLYLALASRDRATAEHSRRVAERIYDFAHVLGLDHQQCLSLELAGLLHDVGKIGVPDKVLFKSGALSPDEKALIGKHRRMSIEAIRPLIVLPGVIETLCQASAWYDGSHDWLAHSTAEIGTGARMLAIVDAYDAMTSDRVYRKAISHEEALEELARMAGKQFDPELVAKFRSFAGELTTHSRSSGFWSADFGTMLSDTLENTGRQQARPIDFYSRVVSDLKDGVCFARLGGEVFYWSKAAEQLTGYTAEEIFQHPWKSLEEFRLSLFEEGPVAAGLFREAIAEGRNRSERVTLRHKFSHALQVELQVIPVVGDNGKVSGVALIFSDISRRVELETQFDELATKATRDSLTGIYNRAELDRRLPLFIQEHSEGGGPSSLVVSDLDRFKEINDTFGHACGDKVIRRFAQILSAEMGEMAQVARYGGEEFVVLMSTSLDIAVRRCESARAVISQCEFPELRGRRVTSSFGVSGVRSGDTPEVLFARADQALFKAKQQGRNRTVATDASEYATFDSQKSETENGDGSLELVLSVFGPKQTVMWKLEGFIAKYQARVLEESDKTLELSIGARRLRRWFRRGTANFPVRVSLTFDSPRGGRIGVHVRITPESSTRSSSLAQDRCRALMASLRTYLIAD